MGQWMAQPDIPLAMEINTRYTIAQLYFVQENWKQGVDALLQWFDMTENPNANAYVLLSQGYYQVKDYDKALKNVETAIDMYKAKNKLPKEQWYNLARFLYFEKNDINKTVDVLEELLTYYPKKQYWVQVSHMYGEQQKEKEQLAAMETAYVQGMLDKGTEQVTMAYLYLNADVPYKAAKVMDKGLKDGSIDDKSKNWEIAGSAWRQAQEVDKSIPAMEKAAARSDEGELYARLGNIYLDGDQHKKAITAINKGLQKGGVKRPDNARLVLGMAYFILGEVQQALGTWEEGLAYENGRCELEPYIDYAEVARRSPKSRKRRKAASAASRLLSIFEQVDQHLSERQWEPAIAAVESIYPLTNADRQMLVRLAHAYLQVDFVLTADHRIEVDGGEHPGFE